MPVANRLIRNTNENFAPRAFDVNSISSPSRPSVLHGVNPNTVDDNDQVINQISNFVEKLRVCHERSMSGGESDDKPSMSRVNREAEEARRISDKAILDAERFKAMVSKPPPGKELIYNKIDNSDESQSDLGRLLKYIQDNQDNKFYHVTCHVEAKLKQKIQQGEFVELETLIPKSRGQQLKEDERLQQFVTKGGFTYWAPPERENKIASVRKWEQAFRVFAAIYCQANPGRSVEIWQYVHTINSASVSFAWENVYYYDITFRQMISEKPQRS